MTANGAVDGLLPAVEDDNDWDPYKASTSQQTTSPAAASSSALYLGIDLAAASQSTDITSLINAALAAPFDHALAPISYTVNLALDDSNDAFVAPTISPLAFPSATFNTNILALIPHSIIATLCSTQPSPSSSSLPLSFHAASHHLLECFDYYSHLGLCTVFVAPPPTAHPSTARRLARCLLSALHAHSEMSVVVQLECDERGYEFYMRLLLACGHHRRIFLSLVLTQHLPPPTLLTLDHAEQLHSITLDSGCWVTNRHGYPILAAKHKATVLDLLDYCQAVILRLDAATLDGSSDAADIVRSVAFHQHYIHHLHTAYTAATAASSGAASLPAMYRDYLQSPLQPLHDNLSNQTYEVFESDPVKYAQYSAAIQLALSDLSERFGSGERGEALVVWVVGAGRGPLVWAVLKAAEAAGVRVQVVAFEKNKHALHTLTALYHTQWLPYHSILTLQPHNILTYSLPPGQPRPQLLVSELLGSFGDNELSAECMDGACSWLVADGVCIPERSVSYLVPVRNARVMGQLAAGGAEGREMPYVVQLHACERVVEEDGRACFVFAHPVQSAGGSVAEQEDERRRAEVEEDSREERRVRRVMAGTADASDEADELAYVSAVRTAPPSTSATASSQHSASSPSSASSSLIPPVSSNSRHRTLRFTASAATAITGLAGYFTARLYRHVELSTYPPCHTPLLTSWFPLYFPLQSAVVLGRGDVVEVGVWRCVEEKRVWYEWSVEVCSGEGSAGEVWYGGSMVHNAGGKAASIGL